MPSKPAHPIDKHVGSRVRMRRLTLGMSQEKLGNQLGLTFQQIQKYEKGVNRISSSRLQQIGDILGVQVSFFFARDRGRARQIGDGDASLPIHLNEFLASPDGQAVAKAFMRINQKAIRRSLLRFIEALADRAAANLSP